MPVAIKLAFFNVHHISAEISRWILHYAGQEFADFRIEFAQWPSIKPTTPEGTVPYLQVDGKTLSQSMAIARYLARTYKLTGNNSWEEAEADSIVDYMWDAAEYYESWIEARMSKKTDLAADIKEKYLINVLPRYLHDFERRLVSNTKGNGYLVGQAPTWADFAVVSFLDEILALYGPDTLDKYSHLKALMDKIHDLKGIKEYVSTRPGCYVSDL